MPNFVLEILWPSMEGRDKTSKKEIYRQLGVRECFLFQPRPR